MENSKKVFLVLLPLLSLFSLACQNSQSSFAAPKQQPAISIASDEQPHFAPIVQSNEIKKLLENATEQTRLTKSYDPSYVVLPYPNGDVPIETGVCTDVVIRAFRHVEVDLQKEVHEDMQKNFAAYPSKWGLKAPDTNIDHRRVLNLQTFFTRKGKSLPITDQAKNYKPGDIVSWDLDGKGLTHIGIVSNIWNERTKRYTIIHNIGGGTRTEDVLFNWKITGHFRYF